MRVFCSFCLVVFLGSCATYTTPGAGVNVGNLEAADEDIGELLTLEPASPFPARLALVRVQASGYYSFGNRCYGRGKFCVVTTRDVEDEEDLQRIADWPMIAELAVMNRLLLPPELESLKDLRRAAATLKTDLLLVYSLDTGFIIENTEIGPLSLISLGFLPNKNARVTSTASAALYDVRTGFLYGVAESTAREEQRATFWSSDDAVDNARLKTEAEAFQSLLGEVESLWNNVLAQRPTSA